MATEQAQPTSAEPRTRTLTIVEAVREALLEEMQRDDRVVVLGGSAAYGYGVTSDQAIPAQLEQLLRKYTQSPVFTVVNLGYNNEGAYSFKTTLEDYAWLHYDLALLYEGYNDISDRRPNLQIFRHDSPMFRLTGYMPIFPIIFKEKAAVMVSSDPGALYGENTKTMFHASLAAKTGATVLTTTPLERDVAAELRINRFFYFTSELTQRRTLTSTTGTGTTAPEFNVNLKARWEY